MRTLLPLFALLAAALGAVPTAAQLPPTRTAKLYVGDFQNDRVVVYDEAGVPVRSFTAAGLDGPRGICFLPDGRFCVASELTDEVLLFSRTEQLLGRFSHPLLDAPTGMALSPAGELHVSSFGNGRVLVFGLDGTPRRTYGGATLATPNCVAFGANGEIYVSSASRDSVFRYGANEVFVAEFTGGGLDSPMGIARDPDDGCLLVTGGLSHNVVKFAPDGTYLGQLTHPDLTGPQGVAFDERGHLFSSSYFQDRLVEFDASGAYVRTITAGGLDVPRSLAFQTERVRQGQAPGAPQGAGTRAPLASAPPTSTPPQVVLARLLRQRVWTGVARGLGAR